MVNGLNNSLSNHCKLEELFLDEAQLGGHIYFYAAVQGAEFTVKLLVAKTGEKPVLYEEKGQDLKLVGRKAVERAFTMGRYAINGLPAEANIYIDGVGLVKAMDHL